MDTDNNLQHITDIESLFANDNERARSTIETVILESDGTLERDIVSTLTQSNVTDDDYKHAQQVWNAFGVKTIGEYSDLYLKTDVLLLADVFQNFRDVCYAAYSLDAAQLFQLGYAQF